MGIAQGILNRLTPEQKEELNQAVLKEEAGDRVFVVVNKLREFLGLPTQGSFKTKKDTSSEISKRVGEIDDLDLIDAADEFLETLAPLH
jgi:hypothetical protein